MRALALALLSLSLAACTVASAHADIDDVCVTYSDVQIPAAAPDAVSIDQSFTVDDLAEVQSLSAIVSNLEFVRAEAHATSGISSFAFVDAAHITVASDVPTPPLPTLDVYDCDGDCIPDGSTLTVPSTVQQSAIDYVESGSVQVDVELVGQPPTAAWTMDVDVCFRGELSYQATL